MPRTYVSLDLETTGLDAGRDAIIEIGAVKFHSGEVLGTFSTFVNPGRRIPLQITELTGIRDQDVADAPGLHAVATRLSRFVGSTPIVGHSVGFDLAFLRRHSLLVDNESLDTFELSGVLLPSADRYSLVELTRVLGIETDRAHRALADAQASRLLFDRLLDLAAGLPPRRLEEIAAHAARARWSAAGFFRDALQEAALRPRARGLAAVRDGLSVLRERPPVEPSTEPRLEAASERASLDVDRLASLLDAGGAFEAQFAGYEYRPQQVAMLRRVAQAIDRGEHLLVEAPTGVGKSLAYLIPAVRWAVQNSDRVVISTNTINLQEQLYRKDIPTLSGILPFSFRAVVLKGRSHYLCPARLQSLRRRGPGSPTEARVLAKVLFWELETTDGDGDELFLPTAVEQALWRQLSAENEGCIPERCRSFQDGSCYFYRARRAAEASHLVIVNHALLLADVAVENRALPEYKHLVVDEAHHLESATTNGLSFAIDRTALRRLLNEVGTVAQTGRVTGALAQVVARCRETDLERAAMDVVELQVGKIGLATDRAGRTLDVFFEHVQEFFREQVEGERSQYGHKLRVTSGARSQPAWDLVEINWDNAGPAVRATVHGLEVLARGLEELPKFAGSEGEEIQAHLLGSARRLAEATGHLDHMICEPTPSTVYWLALDARDEHISLHAAPLHVGPLIEEHLFLKKRSVVLTSATLRTEGSFEYLRERLNAFDADELAVSSPFDYAHSTLLYLVDDVPEPGKPGHQRAVAEGMAALFRATQGRALGLFTSYRQLRSTLRAIRAPLAQDGITVQAQGEGISRRRLLESFRAGNRCVLLGTRSFWEGVDVPGEALSCLAIAKLPFSVPTDPIFAARSETFDYPFLEYAVPEAILRFLQGFGRLIRTRTDRGVVAVFDKRLLTRSYGSMFIESLPGPTVRQGSVLTLPRAAGEWLST